MRPEFEFTAGLKTNCIDINQTAADQQSETTAEETLNKHGRTRDYFRPDLLRL